MLFENSLLTAERAGLPVAASERAQPASLPQCADLCCWLGGVRGGFSVLSSDCQKRRLFSILDLRNFKSRWTRNLDLITGPKLPSSRRLDCWGYILHICHYSICKKRFEKGFLAEIYSLCASERLLIYLHPIFSHSDFI